MIVEQSSNTQINTNLRKTSDGKFCRVELFYRGKAHFVGEADLPFRIGRSPKSCQMVVNKEVVSRLHCTVEMKDGQVGIVDCSTNGTVVKVGEASSVIIRDEFYPLTGKGCLTLGEPFNSADADLVLFKVVIEAA